MLALVHDGVERNLRTMQDVLLANLCPSTGRVFVCGLALDFCVHDTCVNAKAVGFERVAVCVDAARAAHIPGIGAFGSGFLSRPADTCASFASQGVELVRLNQVLPHRRHASRVF